MALALTPLELVLREILPEEPTAPNPSIYIEEDTVRALAVVAGAAPTPNGLVGDKMEVTPYGPYPPNGPAPADKPP